MPRLLAPVLLFAYVGVALLFERHTDAAGELALGGVTWVALWIACRRLDALLRRRVAAVVVIASAGEVLGSIVLGLYAYRRGGIPLFVPPGHGLVYLAGHQLSRSVPTSCRRGGAVLVIAAAAVGWALFGLLVGPRPDVAGALAMLAFLACLWRGPDTRLFAGMFVVVAALELYGTAMGAWTWVPEWPGLGLPAGNPPSGAVAGYCLFDALALRLASLLEPGRGRSDCRKHAPAGAAEPRGRAAHADHRGQRPVRPLLATARLACPGASSSTSPASRSAGTAGGHQGELKTHDPSGSAAKQRAGSKPCCKRIRYETGTGSGNAVVNSDY